MSEIIGRIRQIIEYKHLSERKFCREVGISYGLLGKVKDIGASKVANILNAYPEISADWLLLGEGDMIRVYTISTGLQVVGEPYSSYESRELAELRKECNEKGNVIINLMKEVEGLKKEIQNF